MITQIMTPFLALLACCTMATWPLQAQITDASRPTIVRTNDTFTFNGGSLWDFVGRLERDFGLSEQWHHQVKGRYFYSVQVPRFDLKAKTPRAVLERYNQMSETNSTLGRWLLPATNSETSAAAPVKFERAALRPEGRFEFEGGQLDGFITAVLLQFGVDLSEIGTIPTHLLNEVRSLPRMRVKTDDYTAVLNLYNDYSQETGGSAGRWIFRTQRGETTLLTLVGAPHAPEAEIVVRAFGLRVSQERFNQLRDVIDQEMDRAMISRGDRQIERGLSYHEATEIIVARGPKAYVDLAAEIIGAYQAIPHAPEQSPAAQKSVNAK